MQDANEISWIAFAFDNAANALLKINSEGKILRANTAAAKLFSKDICRLIDKNINEFAAEKKSMAEILKSYTGNIPASCKIIEGNANEEKKCSNGKLQYFHSPDEDFFILSIDTEENAIGNNNQPNDTEVLLQNKLEELEALNDKLLLEVKIRREIEQNLKAYSEELKLKNLELEQFAYVASHDLQEPLRMISSFTQLLGRKYQDNLDDDANEFIRYTLEGTTRMQRLINDLLIYSRVGRKGSEPQKVNLAEIVEAAKKNLQLTLEETDTEIVYNNLPEVQADKGQLTQLLQNLLSNAIKFSRKDTVPHVEITAEEMPGHWEIAVKDNGIGFDTAHHDRIFNIFQRLHAQGEYSGTGIGLAISKKIVERHGGEIWAESEEGKGATFYFTIRKK